MSSTASVHVKSAMRIYVVCALLSVATLGVSVLAFESRGSLVVSAAAHDTDRLRNTKFDAVAMNANPPVRPPNVVSPPEPMLISRISQGQLDQLAVEPGVAVVPEPVNASVDDDEWAGYQPWTPGRADTYRTVCVRLCDGAFFPISFSTTRDRFKSDAARCQASCGSPAQLFVSKMPSVETEDLVDIHGAAYVDLANAFKFRTSYDQACSCRGAGNDQIAHGKQPATLVADAAGGEQFPPVALGQAPTQVPPVALGQAPTQFTPVALGQAPTQLTSAGAANTPTHLRLDVPSRTTDVVGVPSPAPAAPTPHLSKPSTLETASIAPSAPAPVATPAVRRADNTLVIPLIEAVKTPPITVKAYETVVAVAAPPRRPAVMAALAPTEPRSTLPEMKTPVTETVTPPEPQPRDRKLDAKSQPKPVIVHAPAKVAKPVVSAPRPIREPVEPKVAAPHRMAMPTPPVHHAPTPASATRSVTVRADGASRAQRSFRGNDFWRLSFWEPHN